MSRIVFINRFYYPDNSATSQLLIELAEYLASQGKEVHVITSRQLYENANAGLVKNECINDVHVHRLNSFSFGRAHIIGRVLDYISFYVSLFLFLNVNLKENDTIVSKTDPPLVAVLPSIISCYKKIVLINWVQDLFPEVAEALNSKPPIKPVYALCRIVRNWSYKKADLNIAIGELMKERLIKNNIEPEKVVVIHNWHVGGRGKANKDDITQLKQTWGLHDKFVLGYSGNLGRAHECEIFLEAARKLACYKDIYFLFIGGGVGMTALKAHAKNQNIVNIILSPINHCLF